MRNYFQKWGVVTIPSINWCPRLKHYLWNCAQLIVCLLSHNVITTCINLHLFCEICFWTLIEIFCFYTMFIIFVRWRLSVGIKRFTYLHTYLLNIAGSDEMPAPTKWKDPQAGILLHCRFLWVRRHRSFDSVQLKTPHLTTHIHTCTLHTDCGLFHQPRHRRRHPLRLSTGTLRLQYIHAWNLAQRTPKRSWDKSSISNRACNAAILCWTR